MDAQNQSSGNRIFRGDNMAGYVFFGAMAAFGFFCVLWALLGWLLPAGEGCAVVCYGQPDPGVIIRYRWLRGMGFLRCPLLVVTDTDSFEEEIEICTGEELLSRLEMERNRFAGTGNGDPSGRHQRRGISEL